LDCRILPFDSTKTQHLFRQKKKQKKKKKEKGMPFRQRSVGRLSRFAQKKYSLKRSGKGRFFLKATRRA